MTLTPFTYGDQPVRVVTIDGEPWFVLADLCRVLDLSNPSMVADRLDADALSTADLAKRHGILPEIVHEALREESAA